MGIWEFEKILLIILLTDILKESYKGYSSNRKNYQKIKIFLLDGIKKKLSDHIREKSEDLFALAYFGRGKRH